MKDLNDLHMFFDIAFLPGASRKLPDFDEGFWKDPHILLTLPSSQEPPGSLQEAFPAISQELPTPSLQASEPPNLQLASTEWAKPKQLKML